MKLLREAIKLHPDDVKSQQAFFCQRSGKSRASFYRVLARAKDDE